MSDTTTAYDRLAALQIELGNDAKGRMLFPERCAVYSLLMRGFKQKLVAEAFGINPMTASRIARASENGRYPDVAREYRILGEKPFGRKYITDEIETRFARFRGAVPTQADKALRAFGYNPTADGAAGEWRVLDDRGDSIFKVYSIDGEGWTFSVGDAVSLERFKNSALARKAGYANFGVTIGKDQEAMRA